MDDAIEVPQLVERAQELTDVELAMLLSLIAGQHCIIRTEKEGLSSLEQEIQLVRCHQSLRRASAETSARSPPISLAFPTLCCGAPDPQPWMNLAMESWLRGTTDRRRLKE